MFCKCCVVYLKLLNTKQTKGTEENTIRKCGVFALTFLKSNTRICFAHQNNILSPLHDTSLSSFVRRNRCHSRTRISGILRSWMQMCWKWFALPRHWRKLGLSQIRYRCAWRGEGRSRRYRRRRAGQKRCILCHGYSDSGAVQHNEPILSTRHGMEGKECRHVVEIKRATEYYYWDGKTWIHCCDYCSCGFLVATTRRLLSVWRDSSVITPSTHQNISSKMSKSTRKRLRCLYAYHECGSESVDWFKF